MDYKKEVDYLLDFIKKALTRNIPIKKYNSVTREIKETGYSYEDLADYLPFLFYFGEEKLAFEEIEKTIEYLNNNDFIYHRKEKGLDNFFTKSYDQQDLIFGLILATMRSKKYLDVAQKSILAWEKNFYSKKLAVGSFVKIPFTNKNLPQLLRIPISVESSQGHGMFIELYCLCYELTKDDSYLQKAKKLKNDLMENDCFKKYSFFPFYKPKGFLGNLYYRYNPVFKSKENKFQLLKQNSNTVLGILRLYYNLKSDEKKQLGKEIMNILDTWLENFYDKKNNVFYTNFDIESKTKNANLNCFHIIDILVTSYLLFGKKKYLDFAQKIVDSFLKYKSKTTGLLPFYHPKIKPTYKHLKLPVEADWLDSSIDFSIALMRLNQIVKKKKYDVAVNNFIESIVKYHKTDFGYIGSVDINSGKVVEPEYSVKNTALVLKVFVALKEQDRINLFNDKIYYVLQDR